MPRGEKSAYTDKQKRKAEHIEESYESRAARLGHRQQAGRRRQEGRFRQILRAVRCARAGAADGARSAPHRAAGG
jgi:hypothetical protein